MQATAKSQDTQTAADPADKADDSGYVGKHRPSRLTLGRQRVRVTQLADRDSAPTS